MRVDADKLVQACRDEAADAGITVTATLQPLAGPFAPVKPPIYPGTPRDNAPRFQEDRRWWGDPPRETRMVVLDNTPSQANRLEAALQEMRADLGLPEIALDLAEVGELPSHLPRRISSFQFPHRQADAYLRDAVLDGRPFRNTASGAVVDATAESPESLFNWFPQALLFGYWQSHSGKKGTQAKLARSWVSEIVGVAPATDGEWTRVLGLKGDPLNLSVDEQVTYDPDDPTDWQMTDLSGRARGKRLSEIGHGQVPLDGTALAGVSFQSIEQRATVSFAGLRRIRCRNPEHNALGRALLVALGLLAHVAAFGRAFSLRSGCDLRPIATGWHWRGERSDQQVEMPTLDDLRSLFLEARERATSAGLISGGGWGADALVVTPNIELRKAIAQTWTQAKAEC